MNAAWYYPLREGHESAFTVDVSRLLFGHGLLKELGSHARALGMKRLALFTDARVGALHQVADALRSLRAERLCISMEMAK